MRDKRQEGSQAHPYPQAERGGFSGFYGPVVKIAHINISELVKPDPGMQQEATGVGWEGKGGRVRTDGRR